MRLDKHLAESHPERSRAQWQRAVERGEVRVDGVVETVTKSLVPQTATIEFEPIATIDINLDLPILYQNDDVTVYNKPTGILTHAKGTEIQEVTVADVAAKLFHDSDTTNRTAIVHRLDRGTSGVIITARTHEARSFLQKQFQTRKAKKTYLAIVCGVPKHDHALIDLPIVRNPKRPSSFRVGAGGKPAQTEYWVRASNGSRSVVELRPTTGRTHQLRVHLAHIHTPILGDALYGGEPSDRIWLHAQSLEITLPGGERRTFVAPIPDDMQRLIDEVSR